MAVDRLWKAEIQIPSGYVYTGGVSDFFVILRTATFTANASQIIDADHADNAQSDGGDLIFTTDSAGNNRIACDIIRWSLNNNPALSDVVIAVGRFSLSSSSTNSIWVWWGHASAQSQPAVGAAYGQYAVYPTNMTGYFPFEDASGGPSQRTGSGRTATLNNGASYSSSGAYGYGGSLALDGSNDYVSTNGTIDDFGSASTKTFMAVVKVDGSSPSVGNVYDGDYIIGDTAGYFGLVNANGNVYAYNYSGGEQTVSQAESSGSWKHYAVTHGSGNLKLYEDGGIIGSTSSGNSDSASGTVQFGKGYGSGYFGNGLDDVRIYDAEISLAVISTIYSNIANDASAVAQTPESASTDRTASAALTVGAATLSGTATFTAPTFSASSEVTVGAVTLSGTATFTAPTFSASAAVTIGATTFSGSAEFIPDDVFTASAAVTIGPATLAGTAEFTAPVFSAAAILTTSAATLSGTAEFTAPVFSSSASLTIGASVLTATATFTVPTFSASSTVVIGAATLSGTAEFTAPVFSSSASLTISGTTFAGTATYGSVVFIAEATVSVGAAVLVAEGSVQTPVFNATAAMSVGPAIIVATATFDPPVFTASASLVSGAATLNAISGEFIIDHTAIVLRLMTSGVI